MSDAPDLEALKAKYREQLAHLEECNRRVAALGGCESSIVDSSFSFFWNRIRREEAERARLEQENLAALRERHPGLWGDGSLDISALLADYRSGLRPPINCCRPDPLPTLTRPEQAAILYKHGAEIKEICRLMDLSGSCVSSYLRKTGCIPCPPPKLVAYADILPPRVAAAQAKWEMERRIMRARDAGATLDEIAAALRLSRERVRQIEERGRRRKARGSRAPLEDYLHGYEGLTGQQIADRLRDLAGRLSNAPPAQLPLPPTQV